MLEQKWALVYTHTHTHMSLVNGSYKCLYFSAYKGCRSEKCILNLVCLFEIVNQAILSSFFYLQSFKPLLKLLLVSLYWCHCAKKGHLLGTVPSWSTERLTCGQKKIKKYWRERRFLSQKQLERQQTDAFHMLDKQRALGKGSTVWDVQRLHVLLTALEKTTMNPQSPWWSTDMAVTATRFYPTHCW